MFRDELGKGIRPLQYAVAAIVSLESNSESRYLLIGKTILAGAYDFDHRNAQGKKPSFSSVLARAHESLYLEQALTAVSEKRTTGSTSSEICAAIMPNAKLELILGEEYVKEASYVGKSMVVPILREKLKDRKIDHRNDRLIDFGAAISRKLYKQAGYLDAVPVDVRALNPASLPPIMKILTRELRTIEECARDI